MNRRERRRQAKDARGAGTLHAWDDIDLKNDIDGAMALTSCLDAVVTPARTLRDAVEKVKIAPLLPGSQTGLKPEMQTCTPIKTTTRHGWIMPL